MGKNGMELVRASDATLQTIKGGINPFLSGSLKSAGIDATMFLRCAAQQLEGVDFDPRSLGPALVTFAMAGLLPNKALGHGYLIPYRQNGVAMITPVFGYKGLIELATRARPQNGAVLTSKRFDVVLDTEQFDPLELGVDEACRRHVPATDRNPNKQTCYEAISYAYAQFGYAVNVGGIIHTYYETELMGFGDIAASRDCSKARSGPWHEWPLRMAQRVPVRRLCSSGRVPLGLYPGAALAAEGAADVGNFADMLKALSGVAMNSRDEKALQPMLEMGMEAAHESSDTRPQISGMDAYKAEASELYTDLRGADTPDDIRAVVGQLKRVWKQHNGDKQFHDEMADKYLEGAGLK